MVIVTTIIKSDIFGKGMVSNLAVVTTGFGKEKCGNPPYPPWYRMNCLLHKILSPSRSHFGQNFLIFYKRKSS